MPGPFLAQQLKAWPEVRSSLDLDGFDQVLAPDDVVSLSIDGLGTQAQRLRPA